MSHDDATSPMPSLEDEVAITITMNGQSVRLPWPSDRPIDMSTLEEWIVAQSRVAATSGSVLPSATDAAVLSVLSDVPRNRVASAMS